MSRVLGSLAWNHRKCSFRNSRVTTLGSRSGSRGRAAGSWRWISSLLSTASGSDLWQSSVLTRAAGSPRGRLPRG
eukprot:5124961-Pyramimonas_sp.AAC.1